MTVPTIGVVGFSDSGKTRVASALVRALSARGYRVAAFKHAPHGHEPSPPGKDSDKLCAAGAQEVAVSSPGMVTRTVMRSGDRTLEELAAGLTTPLDIVIAEGFKASNVPKVVVESCEPLTPYPSHVFAVVGDASSAPAGVAAFAIDQMEGLATLVEERFLVQRDPAYAEPEEAVSLIVDGVPIPLKGYPACALDETLRGFLRSLKGVPRGARNIEVHLRAERGLC